MFRIFVMVLVTKSPMIECLAANSGLRCVSYISVALLELFSCIAFCRSGRGGSIMGKEGVPTYQYIGITIHRSDGPFNTLQATLGRMIDYLRKPVLWSNIGDFKFATY